MKKIAIIGTGELAEQILILINESAEYNVVGFYDDYYPENEVVFKDYVVLGTTNEILSDFNKNKFDSLLIAIGYKHMKRRKELFDYFYKKIPFEKLIHKSCIICKDVVIGEGSILYPGCIIDKKTIIKNNVLLNIGVVIAHDCIIENHSFLAPRTVISGFVKVGSCCFLGTGTITVDSISIGNSVTTGSGTVIIKDLMNNCRYVGNPAKKIYKYDSIQ